MQLAAQQGNSRVGLKFDSEREVLLKHRSMCSRTFSVSSTKQLPLHATPFVVWFFHDQVWSGEDNILCSASPKRRWSRLRWTASGSRTFLHSHRAPVGVGEAARKTVNRAALSSEAGSFSRKPFQAPQNLSHLSELQNFDISDSGKHEQRDLLELSIMHHRQLD